MNGLHEAFEEIVADVPVYGDLNRAIERADRERRHRNGLVAGLAAAAAVVAVIAGVLAINGDEDRTQEPVAPTPTRTAAPTPTESETIPIGRSEGVAVHQVGNGGLEVAGQTVPGNWGVNDSRGDVWVAMKTGEDGYESQWWGKGTTTHKMPPSVGSVLRGGVVISQDAHWIVWTRPSADVYGRNPPRVMEVVDTATGKVRWSRKADADAPEIGALAVTNDGVVVFAHCLEPFLDSGGWTQCADARVDAWAPKAGATGTVPAGVVGTQGVPAGYIPGLNPLVQQSGAHNGLLVQETPSSRPQYVHLSERGHVEVVATLPRSTLAVTADERFALLAGGCPGQRRCRWSVLPIEGGERRSIRPPGRLGDPEINGFLSFVVEQDDLLLVRATDVPGTPAAVRCSLAQARCVLIRR